MFVRIKYLIWGVGTTPKGLENTINHEVIYEKEENIKEIVEDEKRGGIQYYQVVFKNGETIEHVEDISYPTTSNVEIDSVSVNQHTDISNLSSVLNKLDETLNKILDKKE